MNRHHLRSALSRVRQSGAKLAFAALAAFAGLGLTMPAAHAATTPTTDQTKYPIVLVHGFLGFNSILGIEYFYDIPETLRAQGATVYIASVNPSQTTAYRGEELLQEMQQWAAANNIKKFNLIGHSHGGPTARYVAGVAPQLVASVTSVGGVNFGTPVADDVLANTQAGSGFDQLATGGLALIAWLSGNTTYSQTSLMAALNSLSTAGSLAFNAQYPAGAPTSTCGSGPEVASVNGQAIRWYSVGGTSVSTNGLDPSDLILEGAALYFKGAASDGLVGRCSSHWGLVLRDNYPWNHLDEINQVFGLIGSNAPSPVAFYQAQVNRLKLAGL